jgi:hypothetical protein
MKFVGSLTLATVLVFSISSCQKDDVPFESENTNKLKTYTEAIHSSVIGDVTQTFNLSYDNNNRIVSMISVEDPGDKFIFSYNSSSAYTLDIFNSNAVVIHEEAFHNGHNLMDSTFQYNDEGDTTTEKYIYNSENLLVKRKTYEYTTDGGSVLSEVTDYTYDANKNLVQETVQGGVITYSYDEVVLNTIDLFPAFFNPVKQLPTKTTFTSGSQQEVAEHTYSFDSQNRLITDKATLSTGDEIIKSYTYF